MDNLNCKTKAHTRVCEENKLELEGKNDAYWNNFVVMGVSLKDHIERMRGQIKMIFSRMIKHKIKVAVQLIICTGKSRVFALVTEMNAKTCRLADS